MMIIRLYKQYILTRDQYADMVLYTMLRVLSSGEHAAASMEIARKIFGGKE